MTVSRSSAQYVCADCGRDLPSASPSAACLCGGTLRQRIDAEGAVYRRPLTADAPQWDPLKDWTVKYLQLVWNITELRRMNTPGSDADKLDVRRTVESAFAACSSLAEWLTAGPEPITVSPGDVNRFMKREPMSICTALVGPTAEAEANARIVPVGFARPPQFWVEYRRPDATAVRYDALDLAERCLRAWHGFLAERGVAVPTWQR